MGDDWYETVYRNKHSEINEFLDRKANTGRSHRTLNAYSRVLQRFYHDHFPELKPGETQVYHIEEYLSILGTREVNQNTKRRYLECLSSFFSWAMKRPRYEEITGNPAAVVLEEIPKVIKDRPDCATWENGKKIIHHINDPRDRLVAVIMAKTGCRVSEALGIEDDDLNLEDGFIRLTDRKGGKQTVVPIDEETVRAVNQFQYVDQSRKQRDLLFVSYRNGNRLTRERIRRSVVDAAVRAEVMEKDEHRFEKKFTPHTYRTVFTTLMRNQGMKDHILQYIRGDSESETMDIYTKVDRNQAREEYLKYIKPLDL